MNPIAHIGTRVFPSLIGLTLVLGCSAEPPAAAPPSIPVTGKTTKEPSQESAAEAPTGAPTPSATDPEPSVAAPDSSEPPRKPATVAEAKAAFDLESFPLPEGAEHPSPRRLGELTYFASGKVEDIFDFQREKLLTLGFKELPDGSVTAESANGTFTRDGQRVSVSVSNYGSADDRPTVYLVNHGNVDPGRLPVPENCKVFYSGPANALFLGEKSVDETVAAVSKLLEADGWTPYGTAGDTHYFRQNAIRLLATIGAAPAQGGKTMISFSTEQMSAELPAPPRMLDAQYTDSTKTLMFDTDQSEPELQEYYQRILSDLGWSATTENPVEMDWKKLVIFRNSVGDLLELETTVVDGKTRAQLKHQSSAEVAEIDRLVKEEIERRRKQAEEEASTPKPTVAIKTPVGAEEIEVAASEFKCKVGIGKAKEAFDALRKQFTDGGWTEDMLTQDPNIGHASYSKGDMAVTVVYVETGLFPADVTVTGFGVEVTVAD